MKSFKILITAFAMVAVLFTGCKKEVVTGIDTSKAGVTDFTYDEENSSSTSIAFYWDAAEAVKAGATSFSVQLAQNADFTDIDMYNSAIGQTIQVSANPNDAVIMTGLVENTWYYARVRANYARSIYSDWTVLKEDDAVVCISVGHGIVVMDFRTPQGLTAKALKFDKISAAWGVVAPADGYAPEYKKASDSQWIVLPETENAGFTVDGLAEDTEYAVRVRAFRNADGGSAKEYTEYAETTVKTPAKAIHDLNNADDVKAFFSTGLSKATNSDVFNLKADVDLGGSTFPCAGTFPCEFVGGNHTIKGAKFENGIAGTLEGSFKGVTFDGCTFNASAFDKVAAEASISDVTFTATSKFDYGALVPNGGGLGILAGVNEGTVKNCTTNVSAEVKAASVSSTECYIGGLVGLNKGLVENCHNTGAFSLSIASPTSGTYHWFGGVVGQVSGIADAVILKDCTNSGAVTLEYETAVYFCVGGVTGGTPSGKETPGNYGIIDNCDNSAAVTMHYIAGGSGAYPNIGGTAGYVEGYIQNCDNTGKVSLICDSNSNTWTNARLAGVAGAVTRGAKNCTNKGELFIQALTAGGTAGNRQSGNIASTCIAGVIASAGPYAGTADVVFEGLKNEANLSITPSSTTGTPNSYYGGCLGYVSGSVKNCSNTGNITSSSPIALNRIGGIAGGVSYNIEGCTNSGSISLVQDLSKASGSVGSFRVYLAGICGHYDGNGTSYVKACTNSGNVDYKCTPAASAATSSRESGLAGILGYSENNIAPADDCTNTGTFTFAGNSKTKTNAIANIGLN